MYLLVDGVVIVLVSDEVKNVGNSEAKGTLIPKFHDLTVLSSPSDRVP